MDLSSASIDRYTARLPAHVAVKLADLAAKHGDWDLEFKLRAYAKGTLPEQEKKAGFDFETLPPDAREIAQIAVEIYMDPTRGDPMEEHLGALLRRLRDLRLKYQSERQQKKKAGKKTAG